jgi:hypothetical protein
MYFFLNGQAQGSAYFIDIEESLQSLNPIFYFC